MIKNLKLIIFTQIEFMMLIIDFTKSMIFLEILENLKN